MSCLTRATQGVRTSRCPVTDGSTVAIVAMTPVFPVPVGIVISADAPPTSFAVRYR